MITTRGIVLAAIIFAIIICIVMYNCYGVNGKIGYNRIKKPNDKLDDKSDDKLDNISSDVISQKTNLTTVDTHTTSFSGDNDYPMTHDLELEFTNSREKMGAVSSRTSNSSAAFATDTEKAGEFDDDRAISLSGRSCKSKDSNAIRLLYTDVMMLPPGYTQVPSDDCEFITQTAEYKEPCVPKFIC